MKLAVMQPYLFPYIGYFQLMNSADKFVIFDDVNFIKKGWINRNNILINGQKNLFTVPLRDASQNKLISDTEIVEGDEWREKLLRSIALGYKKAPFFAETFNLIERVVLSKETHVAKMILLSLELLKDALNLKVQIVPTSAAYDNRGLKAQYRILDICKQEGATCYINSSGGVELYERDLFRANGIELRFLKTQPFIYKQFGGEFVPHLSIIDVLMFKGFAGTQEVLPRYTLD